MDRDFVSVQLSSLSEKTGARRYTLPDNFSECIELPLAKIGFSLANPVSLARSVLKQSDYYIGKPNQITPWREGWAQAAQLTYYFPLNLVRAEAVIEQGDVVGFWNGIESYLEFGSGLGPFTCQRRFFAAGICVEPSPEARVIAKSLARCLGITRPVEWHTKFEKSVSADVAIFSYVLTELPQLPSWVLEIKNLVFIEPATHQDGRRLMALREQLMKEGYYPWAPCVHDDVCPLLSASKKDWCHDRIFFDAPQWWLEMEHHLPMKNNTITVSYLLMKKEKPHFRKPDIGRLVGDSLVEKGKTRQLVCRNSSREFLSWLHREAGTFELSRGEIVSIPVEGEKKGAEIRIRKRPKPGIL